MLRVYWSEARRAFIGKYQVAAGWKNKAIPVDVQDEHEARLWFQAWLAANDAGLPQEQVRVVHSVRTLLLRWVEWRRSLPNPGKVSDQESALKRHVLDHRLGDVDLEQALTIGDCVDWIEHVQKKGLAPFTVRNIVQCMRGFLSDCRGKGWIRLAENFFNDPFVKRRTANPERLAGNETIIHLSAEQAKKLVECGSQGIPDVRKATNVLALCTGLRAAEVQALTWADLHLDADHPYLDVARQLVRPGPPGQATFKPPKRKSYRQVPLHPLVVQVISWWGKRWAPWVGREPTAADPVFANTRGEFCSHAGARAFREDLVQAGVPALYEGVHNQTFHAMRRTFLTLLTDLGTPDSRVAALAGHGAKTVTARHYIGKHIAEFYPSVAALPLPKRVAWAK